MRGKRATGNPLHDPGQEIQEIQEMQERPCGATDEVGVWGETPPRKPSL